MIMKSKKRLDLNKIRSIVFKNIEPLLESLDIEFERQGPNYFSTCPIHAGSDNNRGFSISIERMSWCCWTRGCHESCGKDIFNLVKGILASRTTKEITFNDALKHICKVYKINSNNVEKTAAKIEEPHELTEIVKVFEEKPHVCKNGKIASIKVGDSSLYFEKRGFLPETLRHFEVADCLETGQMKNRAAIPIHNSDSELIAYIGRATKSYISPKFIFTKGFRKTDYLYNYHRALPHVIDKSCLILTEGQGDVWRLYEAGVKNCVSIFGREISEAQHNLILNMNITRMIVLTDDDQAGRESKFKIQRQFSRMLSLSFPILTKKDIGDMSVEQVKETILPQIKGYY